jgi:hypothetical protein
MYGVLLDSTNVLAVVLAPRLAITLRQPNCVLHLLARHKNLMI